MSEPLSEPLSNYVGVIRPGGPSHAFRDARPLCGAPGDAVYLPPEPEVTCIRCQRGISAEAGR